MRTLELMKERGLLILDDDEPTEEEKLLERDTSGSGKRRRVGQEHCGSDLNETGSGEDIVLPFTKTLDSWKEYELNEFYNRIPQRPHFRPLFYSLGNFREWVALGLTMTFIALTKAVDVIGEDTPITTR
ncbi:PREDICTED: DUF724 domain-containing protein 4-like [Camelina sativa]|uniref:DUF724 domain-containing protein 4-like n=1 Tax=Camelina sativa TaxID=90675 RepID=A0ABM0WGW6_CAMSA|nr:PREDICTED: DUF724 domain-containing protein 4-like [Camelina sativa]